MKVSLFVVGKKAPDWIQTGIEHYQKQLPSSINFRLVGIEAQNRKLKDIQQIKNTEGKLLINACSGSNIVIAFDEKGSQQSTKDLAKQRLVSPSPKIQSFIIFLILTIKIR